MQINAKTETGYWDEVWNRKPRIKLPPGIYVETRNIRRLLKRCLEPGMRVLEIGCAPGKILAWVAKTLTAEVAGLDYSVQGIDNARLLFKHLGISGDLRCEDVFETSFEQGSFDCVFSLGVIEHFNDPKQLIETHLKLLKTGGKALIAIPNYAGIYGRLQRYVAPDILKLHNLDIMDPASLTALAPLHLVKSANSYPFGRLNSSLINLDRILPRLIAAGLAFFFNTIGLIQPFDIHALCPLLVLEMRRNGSIHQL